MSGVQKGSLHLTRSRDWLTLAQSPGGPLHIQTPEHLQLCQATSRSTTTAPVALYPLPIIPTVLPGMDPQEGYWVISMPPSIQQESAQMASNILLDPMYWYLGMSSAEYQPHLYAPIIPADGQTWEGLVSLFLWGPLQPAVA